MEFYKSNKEMKLEADVIIRIAQRWEEIKKAHPDKYGHLDIIPMDAAQKICDELGIE